MINKWSDLWIMEFYCNEPLLAETEQEAKQYVKQWIIKEYELPPETEVQERYYRHRQMWKFWVEGIENDTNLADIRPISWAQ